MLLLLALAPLAPYLCCAPIHGGRPIAIQAIINMRKRFKGPPQGGNVAVVVTDIEGYSGECGGGGEGISGFSFLCRVWV